MTKRKGADTEAAIAAADYLESIGQWQHANAVRSICSRIGRTRGALQSMAIENVKLRFRASAPSQRQVQA